MSLSSNLKQYFGDNDRRRGLSYYHQGHVNQLEIQDGLVFTEVRGNYANYEVEVDLNDLEDPDGLWCTCPRYADGFLCKHIWAVILQIDNANLLDGPKGRQKRGKQSLQNLRNPEPRWQTLLRRVKVDSFDSTSKTENATKVPDKTREFEILYVIDCGEEVYFNNHLSLKILGRSKKKNGSWGRLNPYKLSHAKVPDIDLEIDQRIASQLLGVSRNYDSPFSFNRQPTSFSKFNFDPSWSSEICKLLVESGRLLWTLDTSLPMEEFHAISSIDFVNPAAVLLQVTEQPNSGGIGRLSISISRGNKKIENKDVVKVADHGILLLVDRIIRLANPEAIELWSMAKDEPEFEIKIDERQEFLKLLLEKGLLSSIQLPESWQVRKTNDLKPVPILKLLQTPNRTNNLSGQIFFAYGDVEVAYSSNEQTFVADNNTWFERNRKCETELIEELSAFPVSYTFHDRWNDSDFTVYEKNLVNMVNVLGESGWVIHLYGKPLRQASAFDISIESGQDWFDLAANVEFGGTTIALPQLLQAVSQKQKFVLLADGSHGKIPDEFVKNYSRLASFGEVENNKVRFHTTQAMLLDALLDGQEVKRDTNFLKIQKKLQSFSGVKPKQPPRAFQGELRSYQSEGLGWLHFLRDFQLGGCLADDMGLGKTIQVLALLEQRRTRRIGPKSGKATPGFTENGGKAHTQKNKLVSVASASKRKPSIVVVPKSLIFNWIEEAKKFTPRLRILNYTGPNRSKSVDEAIPTEGFDVMITTYGTLRNDIAILSQIDFDYAILDESQAIKNSKAQSSKASRLLRADHRLAMTGTPIENHLGELWSLFEFLNPGMLGNFTRFSRVTGQKKNNGEEREETLNALSRALKPYLLRRTKEEVLTELPPKTEQTLYCDMLPSQRKAYNELKEYYQVKLAKKVETEGIGRSKIQVLEALLRLRQVACDPRLLDQSSKPGAKLELLQQQLLEVISEGHKALIFSQFTSFLSLVKSQLDQTGITYEYLDGQSNKRADSVKRFQEDPSVQAFLISIKAGGHGLNLTKADYVFLLDPWWNPAVEAQAIDRAHRIGQDNPVIAYRMVCRDTVEEKIIDLQHSKRELAEKVIPSDESLLRTITVDDLKVILG